MPDFNVNYTAVLTQVNPLSVTETLFLAGAHGGITQQELCELEAKRPQLMLNQAVGQWVRKHCGADCYEKVLTHGAQRCELGQNVINVFLGGDIASWRKDVPIHERTFGVQLCCKGTEMCKLATELLAAMGNPTGVVRFTAEFENVSDEAVLSQIEERLACSGCFMGTFFEKAQKFGWVDDVVDDGVSIISATSDGQGVCISLESPVDVNGDVFAPCAESAWGTVFQIMGAKDPFEWASLEATLLRESCWADEAVAADAEEQEDAIYAEQYDQHEAPYYR